MSTILIIEDSPCHLTLALNKMVDRLNAARQEALVASQRLAFLVTATPAVIYAIKAGGDYGTNYISDNVQRCLGYQAQDFTTDPGFWASRVHPEDLERATAQLNDLSLSGKIEREYRFQHQDGSWHWMRDETALTHSADGAPDEIVGCWMDITERKHLEQSLKRREAILSAVAYGSARFLPASEEASSAQWHLAVQAVLAHLGEASGVSRVWIVENTKTAADDTWGRSIHRWEAPGFAVAPDHPLLTNGLCYQQQGLGVQALRLRRGELVQVVTSELPEPMRTLFADPSLHIQAALLAPIHVSDTWWGMIVFDDCVAARSWSASELEALRTAANLFGAALTTRATRLELRNNLQTLGSTLEKLKRQSAEIARKNAALLQANQVKTELLNNVTHELRTPLNAIVGFAELLGEQVPGPLNAQQLEFAHTILASGLRLTKQIDAMLEMSRQATDSAPQREEVQLEAALRQSVARYAPAATQQQVSVAVTVAPEAASAALNAQALGQIIDALLDNAIKFNHAGGSVALDARRHGAWLEITVHDSGMGIAPENLGKLFQPLVQLDAGLARAHGGLGLGLVLARHVAELQGGSLAAQSQLGQGSTFTLRLPLGEAA